MQIKLFIPILPRITVWFLWLVTAIYAIAVQVLAEVGIGTRETALAEASGAFCLCLFLTGWAWMEWARGVTRESQES